MTVINFGERRAAKDKKDGLYDITLWVGEDYKNNNEMYVEVANRETWRWFNECMDNDNLAYSNLTSQEQAAVVVPVL